MHGRLRQIAHFIRDALCCNRKEEFEGAPEIGDVLAHLGALRCGYPHVAVTLTAAVLSDPR